MKFRLLVFTLIMSECGFCGLPETITQAAVSSAIKTVAQIADETMKKDGRVALGVSLDLEKSQANKANTGTPQTKREWTAENIQKEPLLFLQDQIVACDRLKAKIEAYNITLIRMEKRATRAVEESESTRLRYEKFLTDAKAAYKGFKGKWPLSVNGYDLDEDEFNERIADAMERIELAKKENKDNAAIAKRVSIRKGVLKTKKRELVSLRMKLSQQEESVKMNKTLAELGDLKSSLNMLKDMMIEVEEDPTQLSLEDMTESDPNAKRNARVKSFLND